MTTRDPNAVLYVFLTDWWPTHWKKCRPCSAWTIDKGHRCTIGEKLWCLMDALGREKNVGPVDAREDA